jgi:hypothetical protein
MKIIIIILQAILNLVRKRRDLIANRSKIPPEYRDDVVVWYSPKKQRLTNYDVIESYAEDFTYWTINNTSITSAQKKIVIPAGTELKYVIAYRGFNASTDGFDIKYTGNIAITYRYNKEDGTVGTIAIDKSGIYHLPASVRAQKNFGFYCNPQTVTEEATIEQLPTSILKDFSGNGLDAYMYGFQGKLNSGVGIYAVDFTTYRKTSVVTDVSHNTVKVVPAASNYLFIRYATTEMPAYTVNVQNLGNNVLTYQYATENGRREITLTEGINEIPESIKVENPYQVGFRVNAGTGEITITQIPDYPNQLCYSGKETLIAYDIPLLTDFTVIAKRKWLNVNKGTFIVYGNPLSGGIENSAFGFEYINAGAQKLINTFGNSKILDNFYEDDISFMTPTNYNGNNKAKGSTPNTKNTLAIGNYTDTTQYGFIGCHDDIIILKRSLTINEINDITKAIFNETIIEE